MKAFYCTPENTQMDSFYERFLKLSVNIVGLFVLIDLKGTQVTVHLSYLSGVRLMKDETQR